VLETSVHLRPACASTGWNALICRGQSGRPGWLVRHLPGKGDPRLCWRAATGHTVTAMNSAELSIGRAPDGVIRNCRFWCVPCLLVTGLLPRRACPSGLEPQVGALPGRRSGLARAGAAPAPP